MALFFCSVSSSEFLAGLALKVAQDDDNSVLFRQATQLLIEQQEKVIVAGFIRN
jgi:hypothetical protein